MGSPITTHILDTATGKPASGIAIRLEKLNEDSWTELGAGVTNSDGRVADLLAEGSLEEGHFRMNFETDSYFQSQGTDGFYPVVRIEFVIKDTDEHYHVPLLLSPFGFSTYRGS